MGAKMYPKEKCTKVGFLKHKAHGSEEIECSEFVMKRNVLYKQTETPNPAGGDAKKVIH
jgi:hypothetical protein